MRIAFLGMGRMGAPMARNLLRAGHEVTAYNRTIEKAKALEADGAEVARSVAEACKAAELCWTMMADDAALRDVVLNDGMADHLSAGAIHVSSSTITVALSKELGKIHGSRGQLYLALPVFGRPDAAEAKKLITVAGGDPALIDRLRPLFDAVGRAIFVAGAEPWQANLFKLCGNFTILTLVEMMGEAFAAVRKGGANHRVFLEVLSELYGSPVYKNYGSTIVNEKFDPAMFELELGAKDIRIMLEAAAELNCPMPIASVVRDQFVNALAHGQAQLDASSVARVAARNAGLD